MRTLAEDRVAGSKLAAAAAALGACAIGAGTIGAVAVAGGCGYRPGSFRGDLAGGGFNGERATVGCLDVAVAGRWSRGPAIAQAVQLDFGNRCDRPVVVDFSALRAFGRDDGGRGHPLRIRDPRGEIRPLSLEARTVGREVLELAPTPDRAAPEGATAAAPAGATAAAPPDGAGAAASAGAIVAAPDPAGAGPPARVRSACVDVGRLARGGPAAPRWLCVARPPDPVAAGATGGGP